MVPNTGHRSQQTPGTSTSLPQQDFHIRSLDKRHFGSFNTSRVTFVRAFLYKFRIHTVFKGGEGHYLRGIQSFQTDKREMFKSRLTAIVIRATNKLVSPTIGSYLHKEDADHDD